MSVGDAGTNSIILTGLVKSSLLSCFLQGVKKVCCWGFFRLWGVLLFVFNLTKLVKDPVGSFISAEILDFLTAGPVWLWCL